MQDGSHVRLGTGLRSRLRHASVLVVMAAACAAALAMIPGAGDASEQQSPSWTAQRRLKLQSLQTLEQRMDFMVPQISSPDGLDITVNLTSPPVSSDMNNRTLPSAVEEERTSAGNLGLTSPQTFATRPLRDSGQQKKAGLVDQNNFEWKGSAPTDASLPQRIAPSFHSPAARYSYFPTSRKPEIHITFDTQPPQSPPVYAYDIGNAYDVGRGATPNTPQSVKLPTPLPTSPPPPPPSPPTASMPEPPNMESASDEQQRPEDVSSEKEQVVQLCSPCLQNIGCAPWAQSLRLVLEIYVCVHVRMCGHLSVYVHKHTCIHA